MEPKARAVASIAQAQIELERALAEMDAIRTLDPSLIGSVAHALSNYSSVTAATVEMLQVTLHDYPDQDVKHWLEGIRHATELMQHAIGRLVSTSSPQDFPLKLDYVNLPVLMERACQYYRRRVGSALQQVTCRAVGHVPLAWADRVAVAVVAENLLSAAVNAANRHGVVDVQVMTEPGHVVCTIKDSGPGLTRAEQARLLEPEMPLPSDGPDSSRDVGFAIVKEFLRRMDGELRVESEPGKGTRYSFRLPAVG
jgi:signal transduction histidine kinase